MDYSNNDHEIESCPSCKWYTHLMLFCRVTNVQIQNFVPNHIYDNDYFLYIKHIDIYLGHVDWSLLEHHVV